MNNNLHTLACYALKHLFWTKLLKGKLIYLSVCVLLFSGIIESTFGFKQVQANQSDRFNMSYIYFGDTQTFIRNVDRTGNNLHVISPSYFDLHANGSLHDKVDRRFVSEMHKRGIKVVPFVSNHWDRQLGIRALQNREKLAKEIVAAVKKYDLDGVNVDIENVTHRERDAYTDFVRLLREQLPKDKELSVAVAANPRGWTTGWHGSYDYVKLAKYSDYLMVMSYDESYEGSRPGPVASLAFVEQSLQHILRLGVPSEKVVLGIAFYGRYWNLNEATGGRGISNNRVEALVRQYGGTISYDPVSQSPRATFTITPRDLRATVGFRQLTPGNYVVWYENNQSIQKKLELVRKYDLKGTGSWSLGQEDPSIWAYYANWLNGRFFVDTTGHWAELDIVALNEKGWMNGTSQTHFSPNAPLTRAQAAVILVRALGLSHAGERNSFRDVHEQHWAKREIEIAASHQLMRGINEQQFGPQMPITREQLAVIFSRLINFPEIDTRPLTQVRPFHDVSPLHWAYLDILRVNQFNIIRGYQDGRFGIQEVVSRAQMAAIMNRIANDPLFVVRY
jgi:spore germination protein YaaH